MKSCQRATGDRSIHITEGSCVQATSLKSRPGYNFKIPSVSPRTNHFCIKIKTIITGIIATI